MTQIFYAQQSKHQVRKDDFILNVMWMRMRGKNAQRE